MPRNVEVKAALADRNAAMSTARLLSGREPEVMLQEDFFFRCDGARLKLRISGPESGELIRYERPDCAGARTSDYQIARTQDPRVLHEILARTLVQIGIVKKKRLLYLIGPTRVHIDQVENLGDFLEFEVVLRDGQTEADGQRIAGELLAEFGIAQDQLLAHAYLDLITHAE